MRYAQIDGDGVCVGVSDLSGIVDAPHMIEIGADDFPIGKLWQDGEWIDAPTPESSNNPLDHPLSPENFFAMLGLLGLTREDVESAIDQTIADPAKCIIAKEVFRNVRVARRDNPLFGILGPVLNLDDAAIDAAWMQAKDLTLEI